MRIERIQVNVTGHVAIAMSTIQVAIRSVRDAKMKTRTELSFAHTSQWRKDAMLVTNVSSYISTNTSA